MRTFAAIAVLVLGAGCATLGGRSSVSNAAIAALHGGIADPHVTEKLSRADRRKALESEYQALEISDAGQIVAWKGDKPGVSGQVFAGQPYTVGSQHCRQYTHAININGDMATGRGTACRNEDGSWTPLL
jgi:surface antigen